MSETRLQTVLANVDVPEGYVVTDHRTPVVGDLYLSPWGGGRVVETNVAFPPDTLGRFIVVKTQEYREARMPEDYNKTIQVSNDDEHWGLEVLCGMRSNGHCITENRIWKYGRVEV